MIIDHRYEVIESIGTGTWSNVYKVQDKRTGGLYTLKLFQYLSSAEFYNKLSAEEMHHITWIEHPNLAHIIDFGHVGDHIYFLSEYCEGNSLKNYRYKKSQLGLLFDITIQIANALDALHCQDILHKDLKPENVIYKLQNNKVEVKVIDYGFIKTDTKADQQSLIGTLPYVAPEVYQSGTYSEQSDFYALGVLLYKITTGSFPFSVEQITALISGAQQYLIPKFPSELNSDIPQALEKFILRLLDRHPENRFKSSSEIINYINRIQDKQYPFSQELSLVNRIQYNSYFSRSSYSHQLLEYIDSIEQNNGKIVSIIGGDGLGKDSIVSLFRFHLLNGKYFVYDYSCTKNDHEPFFALIKEFLLSMNDEDMVNYEEFKTISDKFSKYLFQSPQEAKRITQSRSELLTDFVSAKNLILKLSEQKPIIFIIRNAQHIHKHTIDFLNYFSSEILNHKVLIVLSFNEYNKVSQIDHSINIQIPFLTFQETSDYINKLVDIQISSKLITEVWEISAGNPFYVREILIDFVHHSFIGYSNTIEFDRKSYSIPKKVLLSILSRFPHMQPDHLRFLQFLAAVDCPLSKDLIGYILDLHDKDLYNFVNDAVYNELLSKKQQNYLFTYKEAKKHLAAKLTLQEKQRVSSQVLEFFNSKDVTDLNICMGIISNSIISGDLKAQRDYTLRLYEIYNESNDHENALYTMLDILSLDFQLHKTIPISSIIKDLNLLHAKMELTGISNITSSWIKDLRKFPDIFEKFYILGTNYFINEQLTKAKVEFDKALKFTYTGKQRIQILLYYIQIFSQTNLSKMYEYLTMLKKTSLPLEYSIAYHDRLALYYKLKGDIQTSIQIAEDYLSDIPSIQDPIVMFRLASIHNNLGVNYSNLKNIEAAQEHFDIALSIWKRFNVKRYLSLVYNNLADLFLKQGITATSIKNSEKALEIAKTQGIQSLMALALLNLGEAHIKTGEFQISEDFLYRAQALLKHIRSTKYLDAIKVNLALAKSKIRNFGNYYTYLIQQEPELQNYKIRELNPLVKTYFYYLYEVGQSKKILKLFKKNPSIDFHDLNEDEFYFNTLSLVALLNQDYMLALEYVQTAERFAGYVNNHYAMIVFYISEIECYIGMKEYQKAHDKVLKATELAEKYNYKYWTAKLKYLKSVIELADASFSARLVLRHLIELENSLKESEYFLLQIKVKLLIIKVYLTFNDKENAEKLFIDYKQLLIISAKDIHDEDRGSFLKLNHYLVNDVTDLDIHEIASRSTYLKSTWNELQYNLMNNQNPDRLKFFIEKAIKDVLAPWQYTIMLYQEKSKSYYVYLSDINQKDFIFNSEVYQYIEKAYKNDSILMIDYENKHNMIIPLQMKYHKIGFILISDKNELKFTSLETSIMKSLKSHVTNLIIRMQDYADITTKMTMMNRLMSITHSLLKVIDLKSLEMEIVSVCIDFTGSSRGFLIKKDENGNYSSQIALDNNRSILTSISGISKTVLSDCQISKSAISTNNAIEDNRYKNSISVQDYKLHSIFCAPILEKDDIYGFIYLDNYLDNTKAMYLNQEIITLLFDQISIAIKNAMQYESMLQKSQELQSLENLKNEFMAIVAHELNTPLTTLQGYVSRLKRNLVADEEERKDVIGKIEACVKKMILTTNDIVTMNNYNLKSELPTVQINIADIITLIHHEIEIVSRQRNMIIKVEVTKDMPMIDGNWEALHLMIYNVVLNAIRFTNDFGTIKIGARRSAFNEEKIANKETVVIYVQDNGIGIPAKQIKNVFRKFYEVNEIYAHKSGTIEYRSSGLGLGLSTSKRIADLHHGKIWIKSIENEGTTVFMSLPIR